jgi:acyl-[acyl-carrier-protein]-phospholipid O-acyltransferase / long-chain-fatty-acid--[acyl-carrier-protein] ligase
LTSLAATSGADLVSLDIVKSPKALFQALVEARARFGGRRPAIIDADGKVLTYDEIVRAALALGHALKKGTKRGDAVGIMLPTSMASVVAFFAVSAFGRIPTMLNFTAGPANLLSTMRTAVVKKIVTAHRFIELAKLDALAAEISGAAKTLYLEDVRKTLSILDKAVAGIGQFVPKLVTPRTRHQSPAVILFTSGTEGAPKGVALSHGNLLANIRQVCVHEKILVSSDILINPLPTFHCFGLVLGSVLPLMLGLKVVLHPTPLKPHEIVQRIKETAATILLSTDTFLSQYARAAEPGDFKSLRFAVCGGERVRDETRQLMRKKHGIDPVEGYGTTETSPLATGNRPQTNRPGTVGHLLPEMEARLEPVAGIPGAGRLFLKGPNVMLGYIKADKPGVIVPPEGGWHDTGDIVSIDEEGYIAIRGRQKRFANVGGETVSLAVVENCASSLWPDHGHAAITVADERKGEQIVLVTTNPEAGRVDLVGWAHNHGVSEITLPRRIVCADTIPMLVTGKPDYVRIEKAILAATGGGREWHTLNNIKFGAEEALPHD